MKIVVLDGYALNPGDLTWEGFKNLGDVTIFDRTSPDKIIERVGDAEVIIVNKISMTEEIMKQLPNLKYIGVLAAGYNIIDIEAAKKMEIAVTNTPNYGSEEVAQMVFAHLLEITNSVALHSQSVRDGEWSRSLDFCYWKRTMVSLRGKTMGLIGYGNIGKATGKIAEAFGMKVIVHSASHKEGVQNVTLDELYEGSDVISLHCPLTDVTEGMIDKKALSKMRNGVIIINTSRGPLIVEQDLAEAIRSGKVLGAGLDVLSIEPPKENNILIHTSGVNVTPHIAWAAKEARENLLNIAIDNLKLFIDGERKNRVEL